MQKFNTAVINYAKRDLFTIVEGQPLTMHLRLCAPQDPKIKSLIIEVDEYGVVVKDLDLIKKIERPDQVYGSIILARIDPGCIKLNGETIPDLDPKDESTIYLFSNES